MNNHAQGDLLINNPVRLTFSPSAQAIGERAYLESDAGGFSQAEKNFAIGEQLGFLIQPPAIDRIIEVTTFDPKTMAKLPAKILISEADKERIRQFILEKTPALSGQQLPRLVLGMKLMVLHEGTLIMDAELQSDAQTNLSRDCYLVAYEAKNGGRLLSLSYLPNTGRLGTPSELLQYAHDEAGDLYLLAQGGDLLGFYQNSLIYRIRHGSHEVDPDWQVKISDLGLSYPRTIQRDLCLPRQTPNDGLCPPAISYQKRDTPGRMAVLHHRSGDTPCRADSVTTPLLGLPPRCEYRYGHRRTPLPALCPYK